MTISDIKKGETVWMIIGSAISEVRLLEKSEKSEIGLVEIVSTKVCLTVQLINRVYKTKEDATVSLIKHYENTIQEKEKKVQVLQEEIITLKGLVKTIANSES